MCLCLATESGLTPGVSTTFWVDSPLLGGSLFDGIGGFPLAWEACGGKAVWASEIEDFCIAVTKRHFPEKEDGPTEAEPPLEENAPKE